MYIRENIDAFLYSIFITHYNDSENMLIDISNPIFNNMPVWPGDPEVFVERELVKLNNINTFVSKIQMSTHSGTHIDLPGHFDESHNYYVHQISLNEICGKCLVLEPPIEVNKILKYKNENRNRIIIKTKTSKNEITYDEYEEIMSKDFIEYIIMCNPILIGFNCPSPEPLRSEGFPVHKLLFKNNILILENLNLTKVMEGEYYLYCFPILINGVNDGAPCRVALEV